MPRIIKTLAGRFLLGWVAILGLIGAPVFGALAQPAGPPAVSPHVAESRSWPRIQPFDRIYNFGRPQDMYLRWPVLGATGKPIYFIECASPESEPAPAAGFRARGQFECRLSLPQAASAAEMQLLAEPGHPAPEAAGRAEFTWNQLNGDCYRYPDYGGQRIFHLRNIRLIITVSNVRLGAETRIDGRAYQHSLQGLTIRLQGFFDPAAATEFAAASHYQPPKALAPDPAMGLLDCKVPALKPAGAR
jgi:hypothetical protein